MFLFIKKWEDFKNFITHFLRLLVISVVGSGKLITKSVVPFNSMYSIFVMILRTNVKMYQIVSKCLRQEYRV